MAHNDSPGMRRDLTEVTHAALCSTGGDGGGIAMQGIHLGRFIVSSRDISSVSPLFGPAVDQRPATRQVHGAKDGGRHAWSGVDATVSGSAFDVGQSQQFGVH